MDAESAAIGKEFFLSCAVVSALLTDLAEAVGLWADELPVACLPEPVLTPLRSISDALTWAAEGAETAALNAAALDVPEDTRPRLLALLGRREGTSVREAALAVGESRMTVWRWLDGLRTAGAAEVRGLGRGSRWHLTRLGSGHEDGDGL